MNYKIDKKKLLLILNLVLTITIIVTLFPNKGKFKYEYQRGRPWVYETLVAPIDFPILKSNSEIRREREQIVADALPHFIYKEGACNAYIKEIDKLLNEQSIDSISRDKIFKIIKEIYLSGVVNEQPDSSLYKTGAIIIKGSEKKLVPIEMISAQEATEQIIKIVAAQNFLEQEKSISTITNIINNSPIIPNIIYDITATQNYIKEAISSISPTKGVIYTGQLVVSKGELITAETEQILDSFKAEYEYSMGFYGNLFILKLGHLVISISLVFLLFISLFFMKKEILKEVHKVTFILSLLILSVVITVFVLDYGTKMLYVVPYSVFALYLTSFFTSRLIPPIYTIILLPLIFIAPGGFELFFLNLISGILIIYTFQFWDKGWLQFLNSVIIFGILSLLYISFRFIEDGTLESINSEYFTIFLWNSIFVYAAYPFLFIFEKVFGLVSNSRLRDLSDATSKLLRELADKAPGTFHHSLQVASLAESAAREIGAYALLARVGSLYHDIGKMANPSIYIENIPEGGKNIHKELSANQSAQLIISHVDQGVEIAKKNNLPQIIIDFILSHHGRSQTLYFYNKYLQEGGDIDNIENFTYNGILPKYKEHVIVMMADSIEAASRTLPVYNRDTISDLVDTIIDERVLDVQLIESDITIREITIIKEVFKSKIEQIYHSRIEYPKS